MLSVLAGVAEYETEVRKERQIAGIAKAKADGKTWGGSSAGRRVKVSEEKEELALDMYRRGKRVARIAAALGLSRPTVYNVINKHGAKRAS